MYGKNQKPNEVRTSKLEYIEHTKTYTCKLSAFGFFSKLFKFEQSFHYFDKKKKIR